MTTIKEKQEIAEILSKKKGLTKEYLLEELTKGMNKKEREQGLKLLKDVIGKIERELLAEDKLISELQREMAAPNPNRKRIEELLQKIRTIEEKVKTIEEKEVPTIKEEIYHICELENIEKGREENQTLKELTKTEESAKITGEELITDITGEKGKTQVEPFLIPEAIVHKVEEKLKEELIEKKVGEEIAKIPVGQQEAEEKIHKIRQREDLVKKSLNDLVIESKQKGEYNRMPKPKMQKPLLGHTKKIGNLKNR